MDTTGDEAAALLRKAWEGEVMGEAYFAHMARLARSAGCGQEAAKLELLTLLERRTREAVEQVAGRLGIALEQGGVDLGWLSEQTFPGWKEMVASVLAVVPGFLEGYERLQELAGGEIHELARLLVDHEKALEEFLRRELEGRQDSAEPISALPHMSGAQGR